MNIDKKAKYSKTHEWVREEGDVLVFGISDYAQDKIGEVVYVELPEEDEFVKGDSFSVVESVKSANDLYIPVSGEVVEVNEALDDDPDLVNSDAFGKGWICKIKPSNKSELDSLLSSEEYEKMISEIE
ncbi:MAG: glycine cleavage system protein GcvH [Spirochaetaceae bacterium]|jgi:glycine cleavage system H protein|nr:glycine cleavage system protein GcvH [Spirochaetaceae bacterium]